MTLAYVISSTHPGGVGGRSREAPPSPHERASSRIHHTAKRRRFAFEEIMPNPSLLPIVEVAGEPIDLSLLLTAVNLRIEALFDREHMLGHAYFLTRDSLPTIFRTRVVPLLAEYFFEDWAKVRAVLADDQVNQESEQFVTARRVDSGLFGASGSKPKVVYSLNHSALKTLW